MTPEEFTDTRPAFGISLPVILEKVRDGDTITVRVEAGHVWAVRVLGLWTAEKHTDFGKLATKVCTELLGKSPRISWHIPLPSDAVHLAKIFTFDRIPSTIWLTDTVSLRDKMIEIGFGFATKELQKAAESKWITDATYRERLQAIASEGLEL